MWSDAHRSSPHVDPSRRPQVLPSGRLGARSSRRWPRLGRPVQVRQVVLRPDAGCQFFTVIRPQQWQAPSGDLRRSQRAFTHGPAPARLADPRLPAIRLIIEPAGPSRGPASHRRPIGLAITGRGHCQSSSSQAVRPLRWPPIPQSAASRATISSPRPCSPSGSALGSHGPPWSVTSIRNRPPGSRPAWTVNEPPGNWELLCSSTGRPLARCPRFAGPFPVAPGPNPPCTFQCSGLSGDYFVTVAAGCSA